MATGPLGSPTPIVLKAVLGAYCGVEAGISGAVAWGLMVRNRSPAMSLK